MASGTRPKRRVEGLPRSAKSIRLIYSDATDIARPMKTHATSTADLMPPYLAIGPYPRPLA